MELRVDGSQLIATGPVTGNEYVTIREAIERNPGTDTIVFANSPGGDGWTVLNLAQWIRDRKLRTVVHGGCLSACALLFLAGVDRRFSAYPGTVLGFHGPKSTAFATAGQFDYQGAWELVLYMLKYTDGKGDKDFFESIIYNSRQFPGAVTLFLHPNSRTLYGVTVFSCTGNEPAKNRLAYCEFHQARDAFELGLVTTVERVLVKAFVKGAVGKNAPETRP